MRNRRLFFEFLTVAASFSLFSCSDALAQVKIAAQSNAPAVAQEATVPAAAAAPVSLTSQSLNLKGQTYKLSPDDSTWRDFIETLRVYLSDGRTFKAPAQSVIQQNSALKDVQTRVLDAGGARIWTFPGSQHNRSIVVQAGSAEGARATVLALPESVNITAARIIRSTTTKTETVKVGRKVIQKVVKVEAPSILAIAGLDRLSGLVYLGAFKPAAGNWVPTSEPFSQIPSHFMQTLSGVASFSGNDLVLSVSSQNAAGASAPETTGGSQLPRPQSSSYQIVMKFVGGHFVLSGSPGKDMPLQIVTYFVQCVRLNRMDLAKAWIAEQQLASIPKYVGLIGKNQEPYKLVAMSQPAGGGARYRLVTNQKHDLIFDVGKVKKDILIKAIFIAPPDPLARSLTGSIVGAPTPAPDATATTPPPTTPGPVKQQ